VLVFNQLQYIIEERSDDATLQDLLTIFISYLLTHLHYFVISLHYAWKVDLAPKNLFCDSSGS
jgi:hypothetical protein